MRQNNNIKATHWLLSEKVDPGFCDLAFSQIQAQLSHYFHTQKTAVMEFQHYIDCLKEDNSRLPDLL